MRITDLALGGDGPHGDDDAPALIGPEVTVTRGELREEVRALAGAIAGIVPPGGRVAVAADGRVAVVALLLAIPAAGRIAVPLNVRLTTDDLMDQVGRCGARVLVASAEEAARLTTATDRPACLETVVGLDHGAGDISLATLAAAPGRHGPGPASGPDDPAWVIFTSGTTGRPKGVVLTGTGLAAAVGTTAAARPLADDDVYLYPFPLYHVSAYNVLHALHRGRPVVLPRRFDAAEVVRLVAEHGVTAMSLAPTMLRMLLDHVAAVGAPAREALAGVRTIAYGAAPMPGALLVEASEVLGVGFAQGYGMTELSGNAVFLSPDDHRRGLAGEERLLRAAGRPGPGVELRLVGDDGPDLPVPTGRPGEVWVRAAQVCAGYWDDPEATAATIVDGWLRTGDIGRLDADGLLTIVDRAKDIIITGGENVASREVEDALGDHRALAQVAVVGVPDDRWGEAVAAAVVLRPTFADSATLRAEVEQHAAGRLARFKVPKRIVVLDALPVNATGKVDKVAIRARLADG